MQFDSISSGAPSARKSLIALAVATALISAATVTNANPAPISVRGQVAGALFTPPVNSNTPSLSTASTTVPSVYAGAKVCFDLNNNGACDAGEPNTMSKADGSFLLSSATAANVIAEISTNATNGGAAVSQRAVFRVSATQISESTVSPLAPASIAITPLSTELVRMVENEGKTFDAAKLSLANRLGVDTTSVLANPATVTDATKLKAVLNESVILTERFGFAAKMVDRGDVSPAALAANPDATSPVVQIPEAQQAAMNVEGIPRYDTMFVIIMENKATTSLTNSPYAPNINALLAVNNQFTGYFATGNPSEPNYLAIGGADDWGITDDNQWNCDATGANTPLDLPLPTSNQPGLSHSPFTATCTDSVPVNHNIIGHPNMFNSLTSNGMTWRTYSESMNPGQDVRTDSVADAAVKAPDHVYAAGTLAGNTKQIGSPTLNLVLPAGLYKTKHHPGMAYQNVRSAVEWKSSNRTLGGGQFDAAMLANGTAYAVPAGYNTDQFSSDLVSGDIGTVNYVIPDQCDDMHSVGISGTDSATGKSGTASDCTATLGNNNAPPPNDTGDNIIARGDKYVQSLVNKIQGSAIWKNTDRRVGLVIMFDEGNATTGTNSCCGWNPGNSTVAHALKQNPDGSFSDDTSIVNYTTGNRGHGNSVFIVMNNQPTAPKGIKDSDAYSHFALVRTMQDMFGLSDPKEDGSYMNRSKYTESFIAANILNLKEYAGSADTHFDSVRPMNHSYVIPAGYQHKLSTDFTTIVKGSNNPAGTVPVPVGPDASQVNVWAMK